MPPLKKEPYSPDGKAENILRVALKSIAQSPDQHRCCHNVDLQALLKVTILSRFRTQRLVCVTNGYP